MGSDARITLVFDPFSLASDEGKHVSGLASELAAFAEINDLLRRDEKIETVIPCVYIVPKESIEHFRTYHEVRGVKIHTVTPRGIVANLFQCDPPAWLTDDDIFELSLLDYPAPESMVGDSWEATIASWLIPGLDKVTNLDGWFRVVSSVDDRFKSGYGTNQVSLWIQDEFGRLVSASDDTAVSALSNALQAELTRSQSPVQFAKLWVRRKAILPLTSVKLDNPILSPSINSPPMSAYERQVATLLPLIFPLPNEVHEDVSKVFCRALHKVRLTQQHRLSETICCLNAIWSGVAEEIQHWLDVYPKGMSHSAAEHLRKLPGFESNDLIRKLVDQYRPPAKVPSWVGLEEDLEPWVQSYSRYIRGCFLRRELNEAEDPAVGFGRWLKENPTVCFEHHKHSYFRVAQAVQEGLAAERTVLLVMLDALPIHQAEDLVGFLSDNLGEFPTASSNIFVPLPTVTEVCKEAILTGKLPAECRGELKAQLLKSYSLVSDELLLAANWQDAERIQITADTRLIVYRDNRIDDQLHRLANYGAMLEDSKAVFLQLSRLLKRWSDDINCITQKRPLILLTSDHGFTYGPTPGNGAIGNHKLDGAYRCVAVESAAGQVGLDPSITIIEKSTFRLKQSYLAARGRHFGRGTMSGWSMSHGGLLPEEVIVPFLEWFGDEELTPWPLLSVDEFGVVESDSFFITVHATNPRNLPTVPCTVRFGVVGEDGFQTESLQAIPVGAEVRISVRITLRQREVGEAIPLFAITRSRDRKTGEIREATQDFRVPQKRRLVEKTQDQDDFENMF